MRRAVARRFAPQPLTRLAGSRHPLPAGEGIFLAPVRRVFGVDYPFERGEDVPAGAEFRTELQRRGARLFAYRGGKFDGLAGHAVGCQLDFAGPMHSPQASQRYGNGLAPSQQAVIAQDQNALVAQAGQQTFLFVRVHGDPFEVVVGDLVIDQRGVEVSPSQTADLAECAVPELRWVIVAEAPDDLTEPAVASLRACLTEPVVVVARAGSMTGHVARLAGASKLPDECLGRTLRWCGPGPAREWECRAALSAVGASESITSLVLLAGADGARDVEDMASFAAGLREAESNAVGVSIDQELQALRLIELSYAANAKLLEVADRMLQRIVNI